MLRQAQIQLHNFCNKFKKRKQKPFIIGPRLTKENVCTSGILEMTAKQKGCKVEDLESKVDKHGNVHVRIKNETS